jgi:hypothetical protein
MQEHHSATLVKIKQHPSDAVLSQVRPYLVNTTAYGAAYRHTHRPAKLDGLDVLADSLAVLAGREAFQSFPNRLSAGLSPVKDGPDAFTLKVGLGSFFALGLLADICHNLLYHIRYTSVFFFAACRISNWEGFYDPVCSKHSLSSFSPRWSQPWLSFLRGSPGS